MRGLRFYRERLVPQQDEEGTLAQGSPAWKPVLTLSEASQSS